MSKFNDVKSNNQDEYSIQITEKIKKSIKQTVPYQPLPSNNGYETFLKNHNKEKCYFILKFR